jgi:DNA uptake protein ComE-like DNA-binding protein
VEELIQLPKIGEVNAQRVRGLRQQNYVFKDYTDMKMIAVDDKHWAKCKHMLFF